MVNMKIGFLLKQSLLHFSLTDFSRSTSFMSTALFSHFCDIAAIFTQCSVAQRAPMRMPHLVSHLRSQYCSSNGVHPLTMWQIEPIDASILSPRGTFASKLSIIFNLSVMLYWMSVKCSNIVTVGLYNVHVHAGCSLITWLYKPSVCTSVYQALTCSVWYTYMFHAHSQLSAVDMTSSAEETHDKVELIHKEHVRTCIKFYNTSS